MQSKAIYSLKKNQHIHALLLQIVLCFKYFNVYVFITFNLALNAERRHFYIKIKLIHY